jgi:hypothetical protein
LKPQHFDHEVDRLVAIGQHLIPQLDGREWRVTRDALRTFQNEQRAGKSAPALRTQPVNLRGWRDVAAKTA